MSPISRSASSSLTGSGAFSTLAGAADEAAAALGADPAEALSFSA